jgi:3'-5' exoribonuclease
MRRLYLSACEPGDLIEDVYVLSGKQLGMSQSNKPFLKAFVSDRSGQVTARMWNTTREFVNSLPDSGFVRIRGHIENYQNNSQLIIEQVWPAKDETYDVADLMPQTDKDVDQMCRRLHELLGSIQNRHLAALVQAYLDDEPLMVKFCKAPAAQGFHHAFIGGLLEHTLNAMEVADAITKFYPGLNRDLVLAGIFLHDIAKTWELSYDCAFAYTDGGQLVGHIVKSAIWVEHKARDAERTLDEKIPQQLIDVLQHIILSHHGDMADGFGSARTPSTPEAIAVHVIENLDAKLMMALQATRGQFGGGNGERATQGGNWTEYLKALGGRLYRPDVAPADAADGGSIEVESPPAPVASASTEPDVKPLARDGKAMAPLTITNPLFETVQTKK